MNFYSVLTMHHVVLFSVGFFLASPTIPYESVSGRVPMGKRRCIHMGKFRSFTKGSRKLTKDDEAPLMMSGTRNLSEPGEGGVTGMGEGGHSSRGGVPDRSSGFGR